MATTTVAITQADKIKDLAVHYAKDWAQVFGVNIAFDFTRFVAQYGLGPFVRAPQQGRITTRGELVKRHVLGQVEDDLTNAMRAEVRYIGDWDGQGANAGQTGKRDGDAQSHPVFGVHVNGNDYHIAMMGTDPETDTVRVRLGFGPGAETEHNVQRLKARDKPSYNSQHFDRGGLDSIGRLDTTVEHPDTMPNEKSQEEFDV